MTTESKTSRSREIHSSIRTCSRLPETEGNIPKIFSCSRAALCRPSGWHTKNLVNPRKSASLTTIHEWVSRNVILSCRSFLENVLPVSFCVLNVLLRKLLVSCVYRGLDIPEWHPSTSCSSGANIWWWLLWAVPLQGKLAHNIWINCT